MSPRLRLATVSALAVVLGAGCSQDDVAPCNAPAAQDVTVTFACSAQPQSVQVSGPGCQDGLATISQGKAIVSPVASGACGIVVAFAGGQSYTQAITVTQVQPSAYCGYFELSETTVVATCPADAGRD